MSFLAAAFLFGLAAIAIPIWLHRVSQRSPVEIPVATTAFLREADEPVRSRQAIDYYFLLALRILFIAALVFAFAQPLLPQTEESSFFDAPDPTAIVVLDRSPSMARDGVWSEALTTAEGLITEDGIAMTADRSLARVENFSGVAPANARLDWEALIEQLRGFLATLSSPRGGYVVHLVSDFQGTGLPEQLSRLVTDAPIVPHKIDGDLDNWSITSASVEGNTVRVTVRSHATVEREIDLLLDDIPGTTFSIQPGAQETRRIELPDRTRFGVTVSMPDDSYRADDVFFVPIARRESETVPIVGAEPAARSTAAFVRAGLQATQAPFEIEPTRDIPGERSRVVVFADPRGDETAAIDRLLEEGRGVWVIAGDRLRRQGSINLGTRRIPVQRFESGASLPVRVVNEDHPVLAHRRDPGLRTVWNDVIVHQAIDVDASALEGNVLLALPDGRPLLIEIPSGKGRLVVLTTALDREWSSIALRPAFVGLVNDLVRYLAGDIAALTGIAGAGLQLPVNNAQVFNADGGRVLGLEETVNRPVVNLEEPGFYTLRMPNAESPIAINVDRRESDLATVEQDYLDNWAALTSGSTVEPDGDGEREIDPLNLAPWLLAICAMALLLESLTSNWQRRSRTA